ncbi:hypothetical protein B0H10DRAFT_1944979 [Mycena sp. CBHHK59/15]|nr:hypothetical protein B0H10DRAFT_1944979 [Mycena sp. CBHHK59/15]
MQTSAHRKPAFVSVHPSPRNLEAMVTSSLANWNGPPVPPNSTSTNMETGVHDMATTISSPVDSDLLHPLDSSIPGERHGIFASPRRNLDNFANTDPGTATVGGLFSEYTHPTLDATCELHSAPLSLPGPPESGHPVVVLSPSEWGQLITEVTNLRQCVNALVQSLADERAEQRIWQMDLGEVLKRSCPEKLQPMVGVANLSTSIFGSDSPLTEVEEPILEPRHKSLEPENRILRVRKGGVTKRGRGRTCKIPSLAVKPP